MNPPETQGGGDAVDDASASVGSGNPAAKKKARRARRRRNNGRRGGRSDAGGRTVQAILGVAHRIYRKQLVKDGPWVRATVDDARGKKGSGICGRAIDSRHHRFGRESGFKRPEAPQQKAAAAAADGGGDDNVDNAAAAVAAASVQQRLDDARRRSRRDAAAAARLESAQQRTNEVTYRPKSNTERVAAISQLECYCLELYPNHWYTEYIRELEEKAGGEKMELKHPPEEILIAYMWHLRDDVDDFDTRGRHNKAGTIEKQLNFISGTLFECGGGYLQRTTDMKKILDDWKSQPEDQVTRAATFLPEVVLPKVWDCTMLFTS